MLLVADGQDRNELHIEKLPAPFGIMCATYMDRLSLTAELSERQKAVNKPNN